MTAPRSTANVGLRSPPRPLIDSLSRRGVFASPAFLDVLTCQRIQRAMDTGVAEPAAVLDDGIRTRDDVRRASSIEVDAESLEAVESRLDAIRGTVAGFFDLPLGEREGASFLRYREGGFYRPHRDRGAGPEWPGAARRQVAVVVFLNGSRTGEDGGHFTGGALQLYVDPHAIQVHPSRGLLVAFPADVLHQVMRVDQGTRDTIVDWYY